MVESTVIPPEIAKATSIFTYLRELKSLQTVHVRDASNFEQLLWLNDIPKEPFCFTRAWELLSGVAPTEGDRWVEIKKPQLEAAPELPDGLEAFVQERDIQNSSLDEPALIEPSPELLLKHFVISDEDAKEVKKLTINENLDIFESYVEYVDSLWAPWADKRRKDETFVDPAPTPPIELVSWLRMQELSNFQLAQPTVEDEITIEIDRRLDLARAELLGLWRGYIEEEWKPWAAEDRRLKKVQIAYNTLFSIYQKQQKLGEQFETVMCFGLLSWKAPATQTVNRHMITVQASITFDAPKGILTVGPTAEYKKPQLEEDFLEISDRPALGDLNFVKAQVGELGDNLWEQAPLYAALSAWANSLSTSSDVGLNNKGKFLPQIEPFVKAGPDPVVSLAPALVLRKRSTKGMIEFINGILKNLIEDKTIPLGLKPIVSIYEEDEIVDEQQSEEAVSCVKPYAIEEIFFPLPANNEQKEIIRHLNRGPGVLVQGPPGTGKSHTIANLVCHFLATGKKILVTSQTTRALQSLRSKFSGSAAPMSALAVVLLGNDEEGFRELEKSVDKIINRKMRWNENENKQSVITLKEDLHKTRTTIQKLQRELREIREKDVYTHSLKFGRYNGTAQQIACEVKNEEARYIWLLDDVREVFPTTLLGLSPADFLNQWRRHRPHLLPITSGNRDGEASIPNQSKFMEKVADLKQLNDRFESIKPLIVRDQQKSFTAESPLEREEFRTKLQHFSTLLQELYRHVFAWVPSMVRSVLADQDRVWSELLDRTCDLVAKIEPLTILPLPTVQGIEEKNLPLLRKEALTILEHLKLGKGLGFSLFRPEPLKQALKRLTGITVDDRPIKEQTQLESFLQFLDLRIFITELKELWRDITPILQNDSRLIVATAKDLLEPLESAFTLLKTQRELAEILKTQFLLTPPRWYEISEIASLLASIEAIRIEQVKSEMTILFKDWQKRAASLPTVPFGTLGKRMELAIQNRDVEAYEKLYFELEANSEQYSEAIRLLDLGRSFQQHLPKTYACFLETLDDDWNEKLEFLENATQWKSTDQWLTEICNPETIDSLVLELAGYQKKELELLGKLAEELAWGYCMQNLREPQRQALAAWHQAVKKIGKGYSKYIEQYKREAREKLNECRSAIPAWVMPMHRVVETLSPTAETFDIAIIDEASQSGPEALILNYIAKKVIVVGDDQQIRPEYVGLKGEDVHYLIRQHLSEVNHRESFDTNGSFFSQAELRLSRHVRLKEHFRCMPEIIQFSNSHVYHSDPLIPLRQFGSGRIEPVVRTTFVEGGYRQGTSSSTVNRAEAEAIVRQICECCEDPDFEGKSIGVITLLGHSQAALIQDLLIEELDSEQFERRKILIGRPSEFQGDERDIIFLSMVEASNEGRKSRAVTDQSDLRSFNVAASRARDVMWLFHSVTLADLKPECLRYKLLSHCLNPKVQQKYVAGIELNELSTLGKSVDRKRIKPPPPFDSWFEVDVFLLIAARGFRVIPQYAVNETESKYRIDLVVEGLNGRLAVECDGDYWHGPEQYERDEARKRELQRCGWTFWTVRGSAFCRDSAKAMESLWSTLAKAKIFSSIQEEQQIVNGNQNLDESLSPTVFDAKLIDSESIVESNEDEAEVDSEIGIGNRRSGGVSLQGSPRRTTEVTSTHLQSAIIDVLKNRPGHSIAVKSLTKEVLKNLNIQTRAGPRLEFEKRVRRASGVLKKKGLIEEYKSKNLRMKLIDNGENSSLENGMDSVMKSLENFIS